MSVRTSLFERIMDRYTADGLRLHAFVARGGAPAETLRAYLVAAARLTAADPGAAGCPVFEAARGSSDAQTTTAVRQRKQACRDRIHAYLAPTQPVAGEAVADTVVAVPSGLSAGALE